MPNPLLSLTACSGRARAGVLHLPHGRVETPAFMPVGTQATVKTTRNTDLEETGFDMILCNTYHLYLRPGRETIERAGGLHRFMGWNRCILTDSGGFQLFSLSSLRRVSEEGYSFQSHIDGSSHTLTPEGVLELQKALGSDVMMVLDECLEQPSGRERTEQSMLLTLRWAERAVRLHAPGAGSLFGIVQGGGFPDLRKRCAMELVDMNFDGYAIGGVAVGEDRRAMESAVESCVDVLPAEKPRYLMGVGKPEDLVDFTAMGVDMFDCVIPTRNARGACFFVPGGRLNLRNARFRNDFRPVQHDCGCFVCSRHSRAYLRHLFTSREWLAPILATLHNLHYFASLMRNIREHIVSGDFEDWRTRWHQDRKLFKPDDY
jgi:queuine tRNA-ribosyltransferase